MQGENKKNFTEDVTFGRRLRNLRIAKGLSQSQLAALIGYKRGGSVSNIENDKTPPDINALVKIAENFNIDLHWLITGESSAMHAVKLLKPFAETHLAQITKKMQDLEAERAELQLRGSFGGMSVPRCDEIKDELENMRLYCREVRKVLNEALDPLGESL